MNLKDFNRYVELCKEIGIEPTWEGLRAYKEHIRTQATA